MDWINTISTANDLLKNDDELLLVFTSKGEVDLVVYEDSKDQYNSMIHHDRYYDNGGVLQGSKYFYQIVFYMVIEFPDDYQKWVDRTEEIKALENELMSHSIRKDAIEHKIAELKGQVS